MPKIVCDEADYRRFSENYFRSYKTLYDKVKNEIIEKILKRYDLKDKKVLEVGCGGGYWTKFFINHGAKISAFDISPLRVGATKFYLKKAGLADKANLWVADAVSLSLKTKFDFIFVKDVIEHIKDDMSFLGNMSMLLKDGGRLLIVTQNSFSLTFLIESSFNKLIGNRNWCGWDPTHVRFYTPWSLRGKGEKVGLEVCKISSSYHIPYRVTKRLLGKVYEHRVFHIFDKFHDKFPINLFGWSLIVEMKKKSGKCS